jgi:hypothetical protein
VIEFGVPMKLVRLVKMCLNETYSKVHIGKHLSDNCPIENGLKQGDCLLPLLFDCDVGSSPPDSDVGLYPFSPSSLNRLCRWTV